MILVVQPSSPLPSSPYPHVKVGLATEMMRLLNRVMRSAHIESHISNGPFLFSIVDSLAVRAELD